MKIYNKVFSIIMSLLIFACSDETASPIVDPSIYIDFQVEQLNSKNDFNTYITQTANFETKFKSSGWRLNSDGRIQLTREIMFDVELENGEYVEFGLWFIKYENNENNLILSDEDLDYWERNWDYISSETERTNFYQGFDEARILINSNGIFHNDPNENFQVVTVEEGIVNGQTKSLVTIKFDGTAFGFYDPTGEYQEVFKFTNGVFKGVIE